MLGNFGMTEMMVLLLICLVLFGAKRIPEIGSSIGKGIREFKRGVTEIGNTERPVIESREAATEDRESGAATAQPEPRRLI